MKVILLLAVLVVVANAYPLDFVLAFRGVVSNSTNAGISTAKAASEQISTQIDSFYGVRSRVDFLIGPIALWNSVYDKSVPSEVGSITFGNTYPNGQSHILNITMVYYKVIDNLGGDIERSVVTFNVTNGAGAFAGTTGAATGVVLLNTTSTEFFSQFVFSCWNPNSPPPPPAQQ